jgi:hypothetical protein
MAFDELPLKARGNVLHIEASPFENQHDREDLRHLLPAALFIRRAPAPYARKVFGGWAQVIVQVGDERGTLTLTASGEGLRSALTRVTID